MKSYLFKVEASLVEADSKENDEETDSNMKH